MTVTVVITCMLYVSTPPSTHRRRLPRSHDEIAVRRERAKLTTTKHRSRPIKLCRPRSRTAGCKVDKREENFWAAASCEVQVPPPLSHEGRKAYRNRDVRGSNTAKSSPLRLGGTSDTSTIQRARRELQRAERSLLKAQQVKRHSLTPKALRNRYRTVSDADVKREIPTRRFYPTPRRPPAKKLTPKVQRPGRPHFSACRSSRGSGPTAPTRSWPAVRVPRVNVPARNSSRRFDEDEKADYISPTTKRVHILSPKLLGGACTPSVIWSPPAPEAFGSL